MIVSDFIVLFFLIFFTFLQRTFAIMVPTGKVGPITPKKMSEEVVVPRPYKEPAQVWERVDEGSNPYHPPVYKYTLLDYVRKYGRKSLVLPPPEEFYMPRPKMIYHRKKPIYQKTKFYYSPLQYL